MENASTALLMAGGVLLAIIVISLFILGYSKMTDMAQSKVDVEIRQEIDNFNKPFLAFNKSAMYGTDVISILNLGMSNNKINNVKPGQELYVDVSFKLTKDPVRNRIFRHTLDKNARENITDVTSSIKQSFYFEVNNTYSLAQNLNAITNFLAEADLPEETKEIKATTKEGTVTDYTITYSGIADFKRKTFKCSKVEYDSYGRINSLKFEQIKESNYKESNYDGGK